jgi:hypothetical protein
MQTSLYCCKCSYPDLLASLGSALGYQGYLEIGAAALIMGLYIAIYRQGEGYSNGLQEHTTCVLASKCSYTCIFDPLCIIMQIWSAGINKHLTGLSRNGKEPPRLLHLINHDAGHHHFADPKYACMYNAERERLRMDAFSIAQMAAEIDDVEKGDGNDGDEDPDPGSAATVVVKATSGSGPRKAKDDLVEPLSRTSSQAPQYVRKPAALPGVA